MDNSNHSSKNPRIAKLVIAAGVSVMVATLAYVGIDVSEDDVAEAVATAAPRECTGVCLHSYCERWPAFCRECREPPCGEPIGLVCCDYGCVAVENYSDCLGDLYWCEYGFQGVDETGKPYVICFDD